MLKFIGFVLTVTFVVGFVFVGLTAYNNFNPDNVVALIEEEGLVKVNNSIESTGFSLKKDGERYFLMDSEELEFMSISAEGKGIEWYVDSSKEEVLKVLKELLEDFGKDTAFSLLGKEKEEN